MRWGGFVKYFINTLCITTFIKQEHLEKYLYILHSEEKHLYMEVI